MTGGYNSEEKNCFEEDDNTWLEHVGEVADPDNEYVFELPLHSFGFMRKAK